MGEKLYTFQEPYNRDNTSYYMIQEVTRNKDNKNFIGYVSDRSSLEYNPNCINIENLIEILGSVSHPSIQEFVEVVIHQNKIIAILGHETNSYYSILENEIAIDEESARIIFKQLMSAVQYLHNNSIVHLDIRPESLYFDKEKQLKLSRFFNAAYIPQNQKITGKYGTLNYQAPEIFSGEPYDGKKADIWACGVLLLSTLRYQNIFNGIDAEKITQKILNHEINYPPLSTEAIEMLDSMLEPDPEKRATADAIMECAWMKKTSL
ncbi:CBL-interacting serine/threonine-protein kinase 25-like [Histomonas meleagridis]|uniref:CBL-interacting serine/threonine-protein kinase 25-like n=1 Tax=Histomonas meleagridis TaxID=135588 RepID=UPI003559C9B6|nr:CBL-interacting serine/threonine-protein kinase 25-like [Histomonas meleagridis]